MYYSYNLYLKTFLIFINETLYTVLILASLVLLISTGGFSIESQPKKVVIIVVVVVVVYCSFYCYYFKFSQNRVSNS